MPDTTTQAGRDAGTLAQLLEDLAQRAKAPRDSVHAAGIEAARADALAGLAAALAAATPAEVDTLLAPLEVELHRLYARRWAAHETVRKFERSTRWQDTRRAERAQAEADELAPLVAAALDACRPYRAEYARRPWSRVFWCLANGGHAHRGRECSTLRPTTAVAWLPEWSGRDEAAIVEAAGSSACTVCYPSAPVDVLARPSTLRPAVEAREAKEARAREAAERAAVKASKGITAPDGGRLVIDGWEVKSETTARNDYVSKAAEAADHAEGLTGWGHRPDLAERYGRHAAQLLEALAAKHGRTLEEERAELAPKVDARRKRDARERAKH